MAETNDPWRLVVSTIPRPPEGLAESGRAMWRAVLRAFELSHHERVMLREACRTVDSIDRLQGLLDADGYTAMSSQGVRVHPALAELRQQRIALARLYAALQIPLDDETGRTQRRATRGVYGFGGEQ